MGQNMGETVKFKVEKDKDIDARKILREVSKALDEKGYNPINQIVGYLFVGRSCIYHKS